MPPSSQTWQALAREAGTAAEHLAVGATAIGRANYARQAYYHQAFFALSVGLERSCKLALAVDHALENHGAFPPGRQLKDYGHNLKGLLDQVESLRARRSIPMTLPASTISDGIVATLTSFANNVTRYYNLEVLSGSQHEKADSDVVAQWHKAVTVPVLEAHLPAKRLQQIEGRAAFVDAILGDSSMVRHYSELGEAIDSIYSGSMRTGEAEFARPYERMYVLRLARYLAAIMSALNYAAMHARMDDIPDLGEFYAIFNQNDLRFRSIKTWSIYSP